MTKKQKSVTIIGYGRFGKLLHKLLEKDFDVKIYTRTKKAGIQSTQDLAEAYQSETIFYAIPISSFEEVINSHTQYFRPDHVLIDVLSVKTFPKKVFEKYLQNLKTQAILTHPMFGPDSAKESFENLPMIIDPVLSKKEPLNFWVDFFKSKKINIIKMSSDEHDRLAANSQGLTHFIGRLLEKVEFSSTKIDSVGSKKLLEVLDQTCNDTWELFHDLQTYNPYTKSMRIKLGKAYDELYKNLLPKKVDPNITVYGIQGGAGSFNEQALSEYLKTIKPKTYRTEYLYTTGKVLKELHTGNIDYGLFAITNSTGGLVEESMIALTTYPCTIVKDFQILIRHMLMVKKGVKLSDIKTIMAHPQSLKQCENTLAKRYPEIRLMSGVGDMVDTAKAAEALFAGKLDKTVAILGPENLAARYNFEIVDRDLQDKKDNLTRFLLVKR